MYKWWENLKIVRSTQKTGNIAPECYDILSDLPEKALNFYKFPERHPLGIYNYSISRIMNAFSFVINQIVLIEKDQLNFKLSDKSINQLLIFQSELLHALHAHIDDCFRILKVVAPYPETKIGNMTSKERKKVEGNVHSWLKTFNHPTYDIFARKIADYRNYLGKIVNSIKHNHARLRLIYMNIEGFDVFGYYVEGITLNNKNRIVAGPDPKINPNGTAFSFTRDLRFHFYKIYEISHYLKQALISLLTEEYGVKTFNLKVPNDYNPVLDTVAEEIQNLDWAFFYDEYKKSLPQISFKNNDNKILTLKLIENQARPDIDTVQIFFFQEMDSVTDVITRPYIDFFRKEDINITDIKLFDPE